MLQLAQRVSQRLDKKNLQMVEDFSFHPRTYGATVTFTRHCTQCLGLVSNFSMEAGQGQNKVKERLTHHPPTCSQHTVSSRFVSSVLLPDNILRGLPARGGPGLAPETLHLRGLRAAAERPGVHCHQGSASVPDMQQVPALLKGCRSTAGTHRRPWRRKARCGEALLRV